MFYNIWSNIAFCNTRMKSLISSLLSLAKLIEVLLSINIELQSRIISLLLKKKKFIILWVSLVFFLMPWLLENLCYFLTIKDLFGFGFLIVKSIGEEDFLVWELNINIYYRFKYN